VEIWADQTCTHGTRRQCSGAPAQWLRMSSASGNADVDAIRTVLSSCMSQMRCRAVLQPAPWCCSASYTGNAQVTASITPHHLSHCQHPPPALPPILGVPLSQAFLLDTCTMVYTKALSAACSGHTSSNVNAAHQPSPLLPPLQAGMRLLLQPCLALHCVHVIHRVEQLAWGQLLHCHRCHQGTCPSLAPPRTL
jgi:hypothetical protein